MLPSIVAGDRRQQGLGLGLRLVAARSAGRSRPRRRRRPGRAPCRRATTAVRIVMQKSRSPANVQVAHGAGVRTAGVGLVLGDQLHRPPLGRAGHGAGRERRRRARRADAGRPGGRPPRWRRCASPWRSARPPSARWAGRCPGRRRGRGRCGPGRRASRARPAPSGRRAARARAGGRAPRSARAAGCRRSDGWRPGGPPRARAVRAKNPRAPCRASAGRTCTAPGSRRGAAGRSDSRPSGAGNGDPPRRNALEDVARQDVLLERRDDLPVALIGHVRVARSRPGPRAADGEGGGDAAGDLVGQGLERLHAAVVAAGAGRGPPGPAAAANGRTPPRGRPPGARSAGTGASAGVRRRMAVEQLGGFVGEVAHQPAGERRNPAGAAPGARGRRPAAPRGATTAARAADRQVAEPRRADRTPVAVGDQRPRRGRRPRTSSGPIAPNAPPIPGAARTVAGERGEEPDRRRDVGQELGPHGHQRPLGREASNVARSGWTCRAAVMASILSYGRRDA